MELFFPHETRLFTKKASFCLVAWTAATSHRLGFISYVTTIFDRWVAFSFFIDMRLVYRLLSHPKPEERSLLNVTTRISPWVHRGVATYPVI